MLNKNNLKNLFTVLLFALCSVTLAQNEFEGKVVMRMTGDQTVNMDYFVKENRMRMEMNAEEGKFIMLYDQRDSKTSLIMPEQKMYMEFQANEYMNENDMNDEDKSPDINKTGEFKDINGYKCEKWIINDEDNTVEAWMTDQLGSFFMMSNPMVEGSQERWKNQLQGNYFPMLVNVMKDGELESSMEVLSVNKMSLNDDLFLIPKDYQKFDMPNMNMFKQN